MSRLSFTRRLGLLAGCATAAVLAAAAPAAADVTVSPPGAQQGSGENLVFRVTNDGTSPITRVRLVLPPDTPVAEVYPLSVDDWAPRITQRTLATPLSTIHGGDPVTETAGDITWIAVAGRALAPGASAELGVAIGPMPQLSSISFTLLPTYAGGRAGPALTPVTLALTPPAPGAAAAGHAAHGAAATTGAVPADEEALFAAAVRAADDGGGPGFWSVAGWVVAVLALGAAAVAVLRGRRRETAGRSAEAGDAENAAGNIGVAGKGGSAGPGQEPVAAGAAAKGSAWRYRDTDH